MEDIESLSIDELKKLVEAKKTKLTNSNILDKYTSTDELLIQYIEEQRKFNKIFLKLLTKDDSIYGNKPTSIIGSIGSDDYQTLNPLLNRVAINGEMEIINIQGSGIIDVIKFVSSTANVQNKSYSVRITCNKTVLYANTFTELEARTPNERGMVCYEDTINLDYILMFKTISYTENLKIDVYNSSANFSLIQVKYHKKV